MEINKLVADWLLEDDNPSIKYRTMRDLLEYKFNTAEEADIRNQILTSKQVVKILSKMHPDGYWLYRGCGEGIDYAMSSSTHFILSFLSELGLNKENEHVNKAVNRYLNLDKPGKWLNPPDHRTHQSCLYAYNLRSFILLGFRNDDRIQERIETLLSDVRHDDGYLCIRQSYKNTTKSCIRGTLKALMAFAELPEYWEHESCKRTANYFLRRNVYFQLDNPNVKIRGGMRTVFPFVINGSLLEPLYALSKMGYGSHPALTDAWNTLEEKKDSEGKYILDWFAPSLFTPGRKGEPNKWVTYYAYLALKYKNSSCLVKL